MKWNKIQDKKPECNINADVDVLVKIEGLSMNASEYSEYKVVKWRQKINCFIYWEYNSQGKFESITYNNPKENKQYGHPTVTHWTYFNCV